MVVNRSIIAKRNLTYVRIVAIKHDEHGIFVAVFVLVSFSTFLLGR